MSEFVLHVLPLAIIIVAYCIRIEIRFAKLINDVCWIKEALDNIKCRQKSNQE